MPLVIKEDHKLKVIDRTVLEISQLYSRTSRLQLVHLCWTLKEMGIDFIEIDSLLFNKIGKLPQGIDFLYRMQSINDIELFLKSKTHQIVVTEDLLEDQIFINKLRLLDADITLEVHADCLEEQYDIGEVWRQYELDRIKTIRIIGMNHYSALKTVKQLINFCKCTKMEVDVCPDDQHYFGTAIVVDAIYNGVNCFTASFMGYSNRIRLAAIEEILIAIKVLMSPKCKANLKVLPSLCDIIKEITGLEIPDNKPVIGESIFKYESGIHADGIDKNPSTYEPFNPEVIGQKRYLTIGKHSGRKSIINKLQGLGIRADVDDLSSILFEIREKSMELKRNLSDEEIREICGVLV